MTTREQAAEAAGRFTALEADPRYQGHLGKVELSREVLRWARDTFGDDVTAASSMGDEVLVELIAQSAPSSTCSSSTPDSTSRRPSPPATITRAASGCAPSFRS
ncbi:adenine nucleotide alpha hydrolase family protein [Tessaracoccus coleopterorum]|uniref:hypothetical protein n=1 Tax=Tessaracoccus coleopterorum TaxID=2714950 RepID=UPI002F90F9C5